MRLREQLPGPADERVALRSSCSPGPSPTNIRSASGIARRRTPPACGSAASGHSVHAERLTFEVGERGERRSVRVSDTGGTRLVRVSRDGTRPRRGSPRRPPRWPAPAAGRGGPRPRRSRSANARSPSKRVCDGWMRARQAVVRALGDQMALELRATRRRSRRPPAWCSSPSPRTARDRERRARRAARSTREHRAVVADHVADRVHDRDRGDRPRRRRAPSPTPRPPGDRARARATSRPSRRARRRPGPVANAVAAGSCAAASAAQPSSGAGPLAAGVDEVEDRGRGHDRHRPTDASGSRGPARRGACITPSAAARPNAEPPASTTASTCSTVAAGRATRSRASRARRRGSPPTRRCPPGARRP